jgi:hypothetical protein
VQNNQGAKSQHAGEITASRSDQIEYMADLLAELREMAIGHNLSTLAGILDLAHAEAQLRAKDAA